MRILDRYHNACHSTNLRPDDRTTYADLDVIGAAGLAAKYEPMGIALARMLAGGGSGQVIAVMTEEAYVRSQSIKGGRLTRTQASDMSKAVLAWWRDGVCKPCAGTGFDLIPDTPSLGGECKACSGTGKMPFDQQFRHEHREIANWLSDQIRQCQSRAGVVAMMVIAPKLDL